MKILPVLLFASVFAPACSYADEFKDEANFLCNAYLKHPEEFKPVSLYPCSIIPEYEDQAYEKECFDYTDPKTKVKRTFGVYHSKGSCSHLTISEVNPDRTVRPLEVANSSYNGYGIGSDYAASTYKGHLVFMNGADLLLPKKDDKIILCSIKYETTKWLPVKQKDDPVCNKFEKGDYTSSKVTISPEEWDSWPEATETHPGEKYTSDLDGNGQLETILRYDYSSGSGCGCGRQFLTVFENNQMISKDPKYSGKLYKDASTSAETLSNALGSFSGGCSKTEQNFSVIRIDNHDYVLYEDGVEYDGFPQIDRHAIPFRKLYRFQEGDMKEVCSQESDAHKVIAAPE